MAPHTQPCPTPNRGSLLAYYDGFTTVTNLSCKRWSCPTCGPHNARLLRRRLERITANRFITLTWRPQAGQTPEQATIAIKAAWVLMRKRLQRYHGHDPIQYVLVIEWTKHNSPHLHVLAKMPYTPQRWLARNWRELTTNPIVDIRHVRHLSQAARYLTAYLTKATWCPKRTHKYSSTRGYLPPTPKRQYDEYDCVPIYQYNPSSAWLTVRTHLDQGGQIIEIRPDCVALLPHQPPPPGPAPPQPPSAATHN